jgi:hypothetical protein
MAKGAYRKGANAERELMVIAKNGGAEVYRGAGSHGAYDVRVTKYGLHFLVDIKCNAWAGPADRARLAALTSSTDIPVMARRNDHKHAGDRWEYRTVNAEGEMGVITLNAPWLRDDVGGMNGS